MTAELPVQIDLSDDASWDQIQGEDALSQEEKDYLKERFNEESEGVIYLSKQELADLKTAIAYENNHHRDRDEVVDEFIAGQVEEGLALSDMVESNEAIPDIIRTQIENQIDGLEDIARNQLFGNEGVFSALNVSDTAKDHMSVSMSMSFMEHGMGMLQQKIDSGTLTADSLEEFIKIGTDLETTFADIKTVADSVLPVMGSPSTIHIAQDGELNKIFMDPSEGIAFFDGIILGDIDATNVEEKIEAGNIESADEINVNLQEISNDLNGSISRMAESIGNMTPEQQREMLRMLEGAAAETVPPTTVPRTSPDRQPTGSGETNDTNEKKSFFEQLMEMFKNMFKGIIDFGKESGFIATESTDDPPEPTEVQNPITLLRASLLSKLSQGAFTGMQEGSLKEFFESEEGLASMTTIIDEIPDLGEQDTTVEKIDNLFFTPISSDESVMKIDAFVIAGSLESYKNADGSLNSENLIKVLTAYKNYREAYKEEGENEQDTQLTYEAYFTNNNE